MPAAAKPSKKGGVLRVTAPLVAAITEDGTTIHLFQGDVVPDGISQESVDHLVSLEYVSDKDAPATQPETDDK
jgi:hypothetical protein